jgi:hypothetical protein
MVGPGAPDSVLNKMYVITFTFNENFYIALSDPNEFKEAEENTEEVTEEVAE